MAQSSKIQIPAAFKGLFKPKRYKVFYGGRGGAKSHNLARALLIIGMQKPVKILCAREIQKSIKHSVHSLLRNLISEYNLHDFYNVQNDVIWGQNGTEIIFAGLKHNITNIKSLDAVDIAWVEEAENVSEGSWETLIPTIRKPHSEIWISFNPKASTDPTYQRFVVECNDDMLSRKVSWRDNPFFPDVLESERKKLQEKDQEAYSHIWEGEPDSRKTGALYAKQIHIARSEKRITKVPYDSSCQVFTAWDLGFGDSTSIWFLQFVGRELRWLDFYENNGEMLGHYVKIVKDKPYNYCQHYLPHDATHGNIRGLSCSTQLADMGLRNYVLDRETDLSYGIELLRQTIGYSVFDENQCKDGLFALESTAYKWNEDRQRFSDRPQHDWASHAADAARYAAIAASKEKAGLITVDSRKIVDQHGLPNISNWSVTKTQKRL